MSGILTKKWNRALRYAKAQSCIRFILAALTFFCLTFAFYYRYLVVYTGYPGWGNFVTPLAPNGLIWSVVFNPYQFNSIADSTPQTLFLSDVFFNLPLWVLSHLTSISTAGRLYVLGAVIAFMLTGYAVSGRLTRQFPVRVLAVTFLAFNPFMIMILSAGDGQMLVAQAFTFIAIYFMLLDSGALGKFPGPYIVLSWVFLTFSLLSYQAFFLGVLLYCSVFVVFRYRSKPTDVSFWSHALREGARTSSYLLGSLGVIVLLILPEIVPLFQGGISTSAYIANPGLGSLIGNSVPPLNLLLLKGYPPNLAWLAVSSISPAISVAWSGAEALLVGLLLVSPFLLRKLRWGVLSLAIVGSAFLGAGAESPLYPLAAYLYLHVPGFGSLNASYFWDWYVIVPLYFLLFTLIVPEIASRFPTIESIRNLQLRRSSVATATSGSRYRRTPRAWLLPLFTLLIIVALATPILSQGYYNYPSGINDAWATTMPASYATIQPELAKLIGSSTGGVAYFNPDNNLNFSGSSHYFVNPLVYYPVQRTASLTYYAAPQTASNRFFYWVYALFYQNETRYLGQLMSLAGVEYFVVLNGTNSFSYGGGFLPFSEGKNASELMQYQYDVIRVYIGSGYVIYRNLAYTGTANSVSNVTLVAGGFSELNVLPYFGFNLSTQVPVLSTDLTPAMYDALLPRTHSVVVPSFNALYGIILRSVQSPEALSSFATGSSPNEGWTSTQRQPESNFFLFDSVNPVAIVHGAQSMSVPLTITRPGNYSVWIDLYHSGNPAWRGGALRIQARGTSETINTSRGYQGLTNAFEWQDFRTYLIPGETLTLQSLYGWNAVRDLFLMPTGQTERAFQAFNASVARYGIQIDQVTGGSMLAADANSSNAPYQISTTGSGNTPFGQVNFLSSQQPYTDSVRLYVRAEATSSLVIEALATTGGRFEVVHGNSSVTFGFSAQDFIDPANVTDSAFLVPLHGLATGTLELRLLSGFVFMSGIALFPGVMVPANQATIPSRVGVSYVYAPTGQETSNLSFAQTSNGSVLHISASFHYNSTAPSYVPLVSIGLNLTFPYSETMFASAQLNQDFYLWVNSVMVGPTPPSGFYTSPGLYGVIDSRHVPYLYIDVYRRSLLGNVTQGNLSFVLSLSFYHNESAYVFSSASVLQARDQVLFNPDGYTIQNCRALTWVRLPYYGLMQATPSVARYSIDSTIGQLLVVPQPEDVAIDVTYVSGVISLALIGAGTIVLLIAAGILIRRREVKTRWLNHPPASKTRPPQLEEGTYSPRSNSTDEIRRQ